MKKYRSLLMRQAYKTGGYRERYAMENGHKSEILVNGNICYKFTYSIYNAFQDGNGATFDTARGRWID